MLEERKKISRWTAKGKYGITTDFSIMPTNGEKRFRLNSNKDGSAYIRTQTENETEGWQNAHYHKALTETYIVQRGRIIFVEYNKNEIFFREYKEGEMFTTKCKVPHNVYMMKNSVIHTVKHGDCIKHPEKKADWWDDDAGCEELNKLKDSTIDEIFEKYRKIEKHQEQNIEISKIIVVDRNKSDKFNKPQLTKDYMHFDKLIWQFPAWIFALLTIEITIFSLVNKLFINELKYGKINEIINLIDIISIIYLCFAVMGLSLTYAMYRFRYHQIFKYRNMNRNGPISPQAYVQTISNVFIAILFYIGIGSICYEFTQGVYLFILIIIFILVSIFIELCLRKIKNEPENKTSNEVNKEMWS